MGVKAKLLGWGELTSSTVSKTLLTTYGNPPFGGSGQPAIPAKSVLVTSIVLTNINPDPNSASLFVMRGSATSKYYVSPKPLNLPAGGQVVLNVQLTLLLASVDYELVYGLLTSSGTGPLQFTVNGFERDA